MKKILSGLLAIIMLLGCAFVTSCKKNEQQGEETPDSVTTAVPESNDTSEQFDVPESLDYGNREFNILTYNSIEPEFGDIEGGMDNAINYALLNRDTYVEEYLGVKINVASRNGQYDAREDYLQHVSNSILSGEKAYDLIGSYSLISVPLATRGLLHNLNETEHLDFSKKWWAKFIYDNATVNNKTFFMSGDISTNLLYNMQVVVFNSDKIKEYNITEDDLYNLVDGGQWTIDRFLEITSNISTPDGEGNWTENAFYAVGTINGNMLDSFYTAAGMRLFSIENDNIVVSPDVTSSNVLSLYEKIYNAIYINHTIRIEKHGDVGYKSTFISGGEAFCVIPVNAMKVTLGEMDSEMGLLPFPKYFEDGAYQTLIGNSHTQYYIPTDANDITASSAVMETMAYASYKYVTPEVFYSAMKYQYSKDENASRMFDIIREGSITDLGILSYMLFNSGIEPASMFRNALRLGNTNWISYYKSKFENPMSSVVGALNDMYHS